VGAASSEQRGIVQLIEQITSAYRSDEKHRHLPATVGEIPLTYESINDQWLTDIICRGVPAAKVIGHQLGPVDDGSWNRRRIKLRYNATGVEAGLPETVFCKASQSLENRLVLGISSGAQCEVSFYRYLRPLLDIQAPTVYYAAVDLTSFNAMIVMNDLAAERVTFCDHTTAVSRANAESQMTLLARLHGRSCSVAGLQDAARGFPTWPEFFSNTLDFGMREGSEQGFREAVDVIPAPLYRRSSEIWSATTASVALHDREPRSVIHCDVHLKNWYITSSGSMGLFDWNCCSRGLGIRDVAYTLSTALRPEDRRAWDRELIALYVDELRAAGGPTISVAQAWQGYRQQLVTALTWWTVTLTPPPGLPDMQPRDTTLEFIRRIAIAMDDHGSLDAFGG
jgi:hypothetical protein